ncbi:hypothetical protein [Pedobacter foliorum]|uniref:hypothetical protein n=1 Tax=Pedobacter foliorum TaxID=2739058 RepID=UPI001565323F|nr:hypothetical protein [Pedobacter foliorum]NRF40854.1 hypothetical protein [Pedobacter foliorum]
MRQFNILSVLLLALVMGCNEPKKKTVEEETEARLPAGAFPEYSGDLMIVPGKSIDKVFLGQDMSEVFKILGNPSDGDAAMGKSWGIWYLRDSTDTKKGELSVYSSYKNNSMSTKDVKQIVVSATNYRTDKGLRIGVSLDEIKAVFPDVKKAAVYLNTAKKDSLVVYDAENEGIAFDVRNKGDHFFTTAITVHPKNVSVNSTYLTIHPGWDKIQ